MKIERATGYRERDERGGGRAGKNSWLGSAKTESFGGRGSASAGFWGAEAQERKKNSDQIASDGGVEQCDAHRGRAEGHGHCCRSHTQNLQCLEGSGGGKQRRAGDGGEKHRDGAARTIGKAGRGMIFMGAVSEWCGRVGTSARAAASP